MRTGLGIKQKIIKFLMYYNLLRFWLRKVLIGFEFANLMTRTVDKNSLKMILERNGAKIGDNCDIESGLVFHNCQDYSNLVIGNNCHIGKDCFFDLRDKVIIGDNVVISMQCTFITHIDMSKSDLTNLYKPTKAPIIIENDAYLGSGTKVLMGVRIGEKSFIAANSLVTKNVEPYTLVGGVTAKIIKKLK